MDWPEVPFTPSGEVDWDAMRQAYNARKREARRNGWRPEDRVPIIPTNDPFFPVYGE